MNTLPTPPPPTLRLRAPVRLIGPLHQTGVIRGTPGNANPLPSQTGREGRSVLCCMASATLKKKKKKKIWGNIKALKPPRLLCECLVCASASRRRHRIVMAAKRDRRFFTGKSSGNKGATLTALKHQTGQREALGCDGGRGQRGSSWCLGWAPSQKREHPTVLPRFYIFSSLGLTTCLPLKFALRANKFHLDPLKSWQRKLILFFFFPAEVEQWEPTACVYGAVSTGSCRPTLPAEPRPRLDPCRPHL